MKKFISILIIASAICAPAEAVYMIYDIQSQDQPVQVERPINKSNKVQYGQVGTMKNRRYKRSFSEPSKCCAKPIPRHSSEYYRKIAKLRMEQRKLHMRRIPCSAASTTAPAVSRFSKDYKIPTQKKISCGGVTYYNAPNPCK